ncbi:tumor protein D52 isoform X1 [Nerophis ophidion]|uniref:tumor protein D52 isoform X1 n=1 Tax=Nerophis ophidion TaxID=159077 RepID=UPI002ADFB4E4|nr:tumor protein D52 isoform X1 [Nerophis ophidion]
MEPLEEYRSPFDFEQGVNASYMYLSPAYSNTPPSSPALPNRGHQQQHLLDPVAEVGQDVAMSVGPPSPPPAMTEEERQELQIELLKVEEEIQTLSQVLAAKERQLADIKRKLGVTPLNELKYNFTKTWQEVTTSSAYKRTSETLSHAGLKATAAFSNVGFVISRKLEDVSKRSLQHSASMPVMRNAPSFKSFGEKVETWKTSLRSPSSGDVGGGKLESGAIPAVDPQQEDKPSEETPMH